MANLVGKRVSTDQQSTDCQNFVLGAVPQLWRLPAGARFDLLGPISSRPRVGAKPDEPMRLW